MDNIFKALRSTAAPIVNAYNRESRTVSMSSDDLLLRDRIVFIEGPIHYGTATTVTMLLLYLQNEDSTRDISLYINSPGGDISAGMAIYDTMQFVQPDVSTICVGRAMSMGAFLLAAGAKGKRYCLPRSTVLIHQPLSGSEFEGQASDIDIEAREIIRMRQMLNELLAQHTGQPLERIIHDTDRDNFFTAEQAVEYGLVDEIISRS
ncbi:MAG TPA: ATP-dependent Clp protease proteolytic subunit [Ktedonosporobacter sp.]|nr:ATP-dependent Clp protease proteolytic subunit [Ktedonosporobacter sp.]